jgi:hypothetical protein
MKIGINYPWEDYGWDFGDPPEEWVPASSRAAWRQEKRQRMGETLAELAQLGLASVRWFLLGDGTNYGLGEEAPRLVEGQWHFDPLPPEHPYHAQLLDDFRFLLETCRSNGLTLLPSLIDFQWAWPGEIPAGSRSIVKRGRGQLLTDPHRRERFFAAVLDPLLDLSFEYREQIVAWELINEPEWVVRPPGYQFWRWRRQRTIPKQRMREFLGAGLQRIAEYRGGVFPSTVGFALSRSVQEWSGIGGTLDQFHYYPQSGERLPVGLESAVVGEVATAADFRPWPELDAQSIPNRLHLLASRGFPAAYLWSAGDISDATRWTAEEKEQLRDYLAHAPRS